jgi:hypothetical protein
VFVPLARALAHMRAVQLDRQGVSRVRHGRAARATPLAADARMPNSPCCALARGGALVAVGDWDAAARVFQPRKVLATQDGDSA